MLYILNKCLVIKIYISATELPVSAVSRVPSLSSQHLEGERRDKGGREAISLITVRDTAYDLRLNPEGD